MYLLLWRLQEAVEQAAKAGAGEAVTEPASVNWLSVGLSWVNFAVLVFILVRFGGPIIKNMLRTRHEGIKKDLDEARRLRVEAEARLTEYENRLANIEREIAELMQGIRKEAESEAARIVAAAQEAAARMRHDAEFAIHQEGRRLEIELRREAAELAVELARKLLSQKVTEADHRRLADQFVREMAGKQATTTSTSSTTPPAAVARPREIP